MFRKPSGRTAAWRTIRRRVLHTWFLLSRGLTLGVRVAAIDDDGRVCLVRHTYVRGWHLPGGGVEIGEDVETALARELREEAEIELLAPAQLRRAVHNRGISRRDHVLVYVARSFRVLGPKRPDREIAEARFWPLDGLPEDLNALARTVIVELRASQIG